MNRIQTVLAGIVVVLIMGSLNHIANKQVQAEPLYIADGNMWIFAASCMNKEGHTYNVTYEAPEPDFGLEVTLCQK